ncbi:uncharacterized protein LOC116852820 [Odontomachus brunneus]|uniref:uncharacterized protein LOC116852820 n=1 Tax=Odontomachus brunneus TaxID=486640 RepID=UPI0013F1B381|nr:uncharacterized protein LOC116852820 [Odontomachus brunneus]
MHKHQRMSINREILQWLEDWQPPPRSAETPRPTNNQDEPANNPKQEYQPTTVLTVFATEDTEPARPQAQPPPQQRTITLRDAVRKRHLWCDAKRTVTTERNNVTVPKPKRQKTSTRHSWSI